MKVSAFALIATIGLVLAAPAPAPAPAPVVHGADEWYAGKEW
ncbi:hypothetical protein ARSEF1564_003010 [Beauveria bassiana]